MYPDEVAPSRPVITPETQTYLDPNIRTLAEALRDAGWRTGHFGKWHLGLNPEHWPEAQGFETSFHGAPDPGPPSYFSPYGFPAGTVVDGPEGEYIADRLTDEAIRFIEEHRDEPFYLNLWHYNVHGPWGHKEEYTRQFVGKQDPRGEQANPIMASMLKSVDESLGRILDTLDDLNLSKNTFFLFFSDNGGNTHSNTPEDPSFAKIKPGHKKWPMAESWRQYAGDLPPTNNAPLRQGKGWLYEGGVRVPMMARFPGVVQPGSQCSEVVCSVDLYPTILELAGVERAADQPCDGISLAPLLRGSGILDREAVFFYYPHGQSRKPPGIAVRAGDWKLIRWYETSDMFPSEYELYNLKDDLSETANRAGEMPDLVKRLAALLDRHLEQTGAHPPIPNPNYKPGPAPISGWRALNSDVEIERTEAGLAVECKTNRASIATGQTPPAEGALVCVASLRSGAGDSGRLYWGTKARPQFSPDFRTDFAYEANGQWQEVRAAFESDGPLTQLRLDSSMKPARVEIQWVRLEDAEGKVLMQWDFIEQ
ncbi:MAG: Arylsulfatase [candidate division BRC1 bacterium ADurb.BinA364]|nr:MAG: Arylsulfatase [candidate division BRC1 bacterium ADurb.BinA364]